MPTRSVRARVCQALMILWGWLSANAAEPPTTPILRIETGMHTAAIRRLATDAANRYLVTGSDDKTVRVWELATGRLARVLRPPIGPGNEGKVYVVALSPDATTVACGGWAGAWEGAHCIYLFDRASGRLLRRITGLPEVVLHLVYSPDGRFLAATLGEGGVRKWRVPDYDLAGEDRDYGARSYGASFDRAGRL
ncbi:MAG: hypothetical protein FJ279_32655, partial [Planctomycetes bacterium]|nr:hypothetical protein [Planctomycetota bacterium]